MFDHKFAFQIGGYTFARTHGTSKSWCVLVLNICVLFLGVEARGWTVRAMPSPGLLMILAITHFVACCWYGVAAWTGPRRQS